MLTLLNSALKATLKAFYAMTQPDPHPFKYNFEFIGYAPAEIQTSIPNRFQEVYSDYQTSLDRFYRRHLFGDEFNKIKFEYHHPDVSIDSIYATLDKGDLPEHTVPKDIHYQRAFKRTADVFRPPKLIRPVHFADLRYYNFNWHPNVEEPYFSDKDARKYVQQMFEFELLPDARMSFGNLKDWVFIRTRRFLHHIKRAEITDPKVLWPIMKIHIKPALTSTDVIKVRVIYGVSKHHVLAQAMFFWPLFRYYIESSDNPLLWGFETIIGGMSKLNNLMLEHRLFYQTFVTIDWSGFDLRTHASIQRDMFTEWRTYFDFNNGYLPTHFYPDSKADPIHLERLWNWQREATFNMPFVLPNKAMYRNLFRGWASGMFVTQFGDSWMDALMIYTILDAMGFDITSFKLLVQGDDSIIFLIILIPADQHEAFKTRFSEFAHYYFDNEARPEKTELNVSPSNVEVLGYRNNNGYPIRDPIKLLAQLYHPRNVSKDNWKSVLMAKCCGFAYASMYHPKVIPILSDIYNHYHKRGFRASELRSQRDVVLFSEASFKVPTDHFPTHEEVTRHLRVPYKRTIVDQETYFPGYTDVSHFKSFF